MSPHGKVASVNVSDEKGTPKRPVPKITIAAGGVVGDAHAGGGHRQVSLLSTEIIDRFAREAGREIKPGEFAENVTVSGIDLGSVAVFDRVLVSGAELEVSQIGKECRGGECAIFREVGRCVMPLEGIFCRVIKGAVVRAGDAVEHVPAPLRIRVVTVSDRASRGEYEDRTGPRVVQLLGDFFSRTRWHLSLIHI